MTLQNPDNLLFDGGSPPIPEIVHAQLAAMGKEFTPKQFDELYKRIYDLYELKARIFTGEIAAIAEEIHIQPEIGWDLVSLKTTIGPNVLPAAAVVLNSPEGQRVTSEAGGYSSTDAICSAIAESTQIHVFLKDLEFHTIIGGTNSLGRANITVEYHNRQVRTTACSIDMLEAIAKAYLTAINIVLDRVNQQLE
ncbi:MAG: alpha-isopropylmalate synthase regulatory domain-containing protein [Phycisphaerae bacterium]|jgi:2-isopropylmalate synthase